MGIAFSQTLDITHRAERAGSALNGQVQRIGRVPRGFIVWSKVIISQDYNSSYAPHWR